MIGKKFYELMEKSQCVEIKLGPRAKRSVVEGPGVCLPAPRRRCALLGDL